MKIHYSAPGKQMISGEWSILELNNLAIVAAINKRVHAIVSDNDKISITIDDFEIKNLHAKWNGRELTFLGKYEKEKLRFIKESIEITLKFLQDKDFEIKPFKIRTWGELSQIIVDGKAKKIGFGSSASTTVAVITSLSHHHDYNPTREEIYKLATLAHYFAQGKVGSAFDIAASTYGGLVVYSRFDPNWLIKKLEADIKLAEIVATKWPGFFVEQLRIPEDFYLLIGWTGESFSTTEAIKKMDKYKEQNKKEYGNSIKRIAKIAKNISMAWKKNDRKVILELLRKNEKYLRDLGIKSKISIETKELRALADGANKCGAAGKLSGSGGGDCGIAICFDEKIADKVKQEWKKENLYVVDATIDYEGIRKEI